MSADESPSYPAYASPPLFYMGESPLVSSSTYTRAVFGVPPDQVQFLSTPYLQRICQEQQLHAAAIVQSVRQGIHAHPVARRTFDPARLPDSYASLPSSLPSRRKRSAKLIDQFLANAPTLARPKPRLMEQAPVSAPLSPLPQEMEDDLMTETLANLYLKQGHPQEAIQVYEQLGLRFPDKKAYFDAQIRNIKQA